MTSYNKVNDTYTSGTYDLNSDILRGEWGFKGLVMTDWGAGPRTGADQVYYSGNDLIEPGGNVGEVTTKVKKIVPTIDVTGLPQYSTLTYVAFGFQSWQWEFGGLTPSATGATTVSTTVDSSIIGKQPTSSNTVVDALFNTTTTPVAPYASVNAAYTDLQSLLASPTALTAAQKAGITVTDVVNQTVGDATTPVVSYVVNIKGDYPADSAYTLRLGDLQRSASRVINIAMQSAGFAQLASLQHVSGITVGSYTGQFRNLASYLDIAKSPVIAPSAPRVTKNPTPFVTVRAGTHVRLVADASGEPQPTVQWQVSTNKGRTWKNLAGQTSRSYDYTARKIYSGREFRAVFTNAAGTAVSAVSVLKVK
jgi:beta-glucosidase